MSENIPFYNEYYKALELDREHLETVLEMIKSDVMSSEQSNLRLAREIKNKVKEYGLCYDMMWQFCCVVVDLQYPWFFDNSSNEEPYLSRKISFTDWFYQAEEVQKALDKREKFVKRKIDRNKILSDINNKLNKMSDEELANLLTRL